jgi:hypothetical protein
VTSTTEMVTKLEARFRVHDLVGLDTPYEDQHGKHMGDGPRDPNYAPNGHPYVKITSFGQDPELPAEAMVMFTSEGLAMSWWYDEVLEYARREGMEDGEPEGPMLHLYWKSKPAFHAATYLLMDQGAALRMASPIAGVLQIDLGFVQSEMLISKFGPGGKEG